MDNTLGKTFHIGNWESWEYTMWRVWKYQQEKEVSEKGTFLLAVIQNKDMDVIKHGKHSSQPQKNMHIKFKNQHLERKITEMHRKKIKEKSVPFCDVNWKDM